MENKYILKLILVSLIVTLSLFFQGLGLIILVTEESKLMMILGFANYVLYGSVFTSLTILYLMEK